MTLHLLQEVGDDIKSSSCWFWINALIHLSLGSNARINQKGQDEANL